MTESNPNARARDLVDALAEPARRESAFHGLLAHGPAARAAVRAGLGDGRHEVRRWCVLFLLRFPESADLAALVPLLHDPRSRVRHAAMLGITLAHAAAAGIVPLLVERALEDESLRVRRGAVSLLAWRLAHPDLEGFFEKLVETERDEKLVRYARAGARTCRARAARGGVETRSC